MSAKPKAPPAMPTAQFGLRDDGRVWISFGTDVSDTVTMIWPGPLKAAGNVAQRFNAAAVAANALKAVRADVRDPDTDTALAPATGEKVEMALLALGVRP